MDPSADDRAPGAGITLALRGSLSHEPPCPLAAHFTGAVRSGDEVRLRILFASRPEDERRVRDMIREALADGGRAMTLLDGWLTALGPGGALRRLVAIEDVPVTLAGIAMQHVQNAMAATAAALGIGLPEEAILEGLRSFRQSPETNPGRANVYTLGERTVVVDYAHNEAGMIGLTQILGGLRPRGARIWLAFCAAGDRQDDILHALGYRAARGADRVVIAGLPHYLRGRDPQELHDRLRAGAEDGGATDVAAASDELRALELMLDWSGPADVIGLTALGQRPEIFERLTEIGAVLADPETIRSLVLRARR
jgi:cyanophycin synthetase